MDEFIYQVHLYINHIASLYFNPGRMAFTISPPGLGMQGVKEALKPRNQFSEFCEETTLNGWYYLAKQNIGKIGRIYWGLVVLGSLVLSGFFIYGATNEFLQSTVIITVDSVTASLDKVLFPSLVVCNQNQVILESKCFVMFTCADIYTHSQCSSYLNSDLI